MTYWTGPVHGHDYTLRRVVVQVGVPRVQVGRYRVVVQVVGTRVGTLAWCTGLACLGTLALAWPAWVL